MGTRTKVTCSACKKETTVPFKPTKGRPVYCKDCYEKKKKSGGRGRGSPRRKTQWARSDYPGYDPKIHASDTA